MVHLEIVTNLMPRLTLRLSDKDMSTSKMSLPCFETCRMLASIHCCLPTSIRGRSRRSLGAVVGISTRKELRAIAPTDEFDWSR